jgi:hypothetical protein
MDEMREAFRKSQEFLDYQTNTEQDKKVIQQRVVVQEEFETLVTEGSGSILELCQMARLSSKMSRARSNR